MDRSGKPFKPIKIFEPYTIKNIEFANRILRSSVGGRTAAYNGVVTDVWKNFELKFARGGVGGIISTTFSVDPDRLSPFEYPSIADDKFIIPLRDRIRDIKKTGCKYIIQIGDPGYAAQTSLFPEKYDSVSSSDGFDFLYGYTNRRTEMLNKDVEEEIQEFAKAARRVRDVDADGLEITAEKGYLIHQFLNPGINRRNDGWGGSPDKRFRLLSEIIQSVKKSVGDDFVVGVRLSAVDYNCLPIQNFRTPLVFPLRDHFIGNTCEQTLDYAHRLKKLGVDYLHVVSGYGFINPRGTPGRFPLEEIRIFLNSTRHLSLKAAIRAAILNTIPDFILRPLCNIGWKYKEGINLGYAEKFKQEINLGLPVIANGGFQHGDVIEAALRDNKCDLVSMARALIANPNLVSEFEKGRTAPDEPCTFCNRCAARTATSPLGCYEPKRASSAIKEQCTDKSWNGTRRYNVKGGNK